MVAKTEKNASRNSRVGLGRLGSCTYFMKIRFDQIRVLYDSIQVNKMLLQKKEGALETMSEQLTHLEEEKEIMEQRKKKLIPIEKIPEAIIHLSELIENHNLMRLVLK